MGKWLDLAERLEAEAGGASSSIPPLEAIGTIGTNGMGALPADVFNGLSRLRTLPPPRKLVTPENWAGVIVDAERLVVDGWAAQALRLGWSALDLFGVGRDYDGLAVWLNGRRLVLLDERSAICTAGTSRYFFNRRKPAGAVMLWAWGR